MDYKKQKQMHSNWRSWLGLQIWGKAQEKTKRSFPEKPVVKPLPVKSREQLVMEIEKDIEKVKSSPKGNLFDNKVALEAFDAVDSKTATELPNAGNKIQLKSVEVTPNPVKIKKQKPIEKKYDTSDKSSHY